jgi:hypothetical protein
MQRRAMFAHAFEVLSLIAVYGFGCGQVVDTWLNGSIFESVRLFFARWRDEEYVYDEVQLAWKWLGKLVLCPRCFMHWVAAAATVHFLYITELPIECCPVAWLAMTAAGQLTYRQLAKEDITVDPVMQAAWLNDQERDENVRRNGDDPGELSGGVAVWHQAPDTDTGDPAEPAGGVQGNN